MHTQAVQFEMSFEFSTKEYLLLVSNIAGNGNKVALTRQLSLLSHLSDRVKALESDTGFLEYAAKTLEKHSEGTKLLTEITQNLQKLRHLVMMPTEEQNKTPPQEKNKMPPQEQNKMPPPEERKKMPPPEEQKNGLP